MKRALWALLLVACGAATAAPVVETSTRVEAPIDRDGDGVLDVGSSAADCVGPACADRSGGDLCPCVAEDADGFADDDGCPDPDNDGDLVLDACDRCPNDPETYQGICDEDGCPDRSGICVEPARLEIRDRITFARGGAALPAESAGLLDALATALTERAWVERVAIVGGADPREPHAATLARARAEAVLEALVARGVARERLVAETTAEAIDATVDPREGFRRVRFEVRAPAEGIDPSACLPATCEIPSCTPPAPPVPVCSSAATGGRRSWVGPDQGGGAV